MFAAIALAVTIAQGAEGPLPSPARTDPCGGSQELLKKYLSASPCVFVLGQASIQMVYNASNAPGFTHVYGYPAPLLNLGVTRNAQITIAFPSFQNRNGTGGASDTELSYKQLIYVDRKNGILGGLLLSYQIPSGSPQLSAPGPGYSISPLLNFALNKARTIALNISLPVTNTTNLQPGAGRAWDFIPQAVLVWRSPGGTLLAGIVRHDFAAHATTATINFAQLVSRQFQIQATLSGVTNAFDYVDPVEGTPYGTGSVRTMSFTVGASYLIGRSEVTP